MTWAKELLANILVQPIHTFCITVILLLPASSHGFDNLIALYAIIPFTSMVRSLFFGPAGGFVDQVAGKGAAVTNGAIAGAAMGAASRAGGGLLNFAKDKSVNELTAKIKQGNYDFVVNACDAGREGEHIFWSFYETQGFKLPVKRFWVSSVTAPALKKALSDLRDYKDYEGLRQSAAYRAQLDWLVGMNFTRAATNRKGETTSIGRVQTPVLKLIVDRELQIRNFKPEDFYEVKGVFKVNGVDFAATHKVLLREFKEFSSTQNLWTRSYFASTAGNVCSETIKKYVESQKKRS